MGNSCHCCSRKAKPGSDEDPDNWEEHPNVVAAREKREKKRRKRKNKATAGKYKPEARKRGVDGPASPNVASDPATGESEVRRKLPALYNVPLEVGNKTEALQGKNAESKVPCSDPNQNEITAESRGSSRPKTPPGEEGSFVNEVFIPDDGGEEELPAPQADEVSETDSPGSVELPESPKLECIVPESDSGYSATPARRSSSLDKPAAETETSETAPELARPSEGPAPKSAVVYMEVSDMGTQLSPNAGCYATQVAVGPGPQIAPANSEYPFVQKKRRKSSKGNFKIGSKLKPKSRRKSGSTHCDPTVKLTDENAYPFVADPVSGGFFPVDNFPNDVSTLTVKFVTKGMRIPVYYMSDDVTHGDDTTKTTMTDLTEDDEDEGIDASEYSDVRQD